LRNIEVTLYPRLTSIFIYSFSKGFVFFFKTETQQNYVLMYTSPSIDHM